MSDLLNVNKNPSLNFGGSGEGHEALDQIASKCTIQKPSKKSKSCYWVCYVDAYGCARSVRLPSQMEYIFIQLFHAGETGLTQKSVPDGFVLRDYICRLATSGKEGYFMPIARHWENSINGSPYKRYKLDFDAGQYELELLS